jgi:hypothetical protein
VGGAALLTLGLGRWIEVQAGFALAAPIERYGFAFQPDLFHRVPKVYSYGHLGAGVGFP